MDQDSNSKSLTLLLYVWYHNDYARFIHCDPRDFTKSTK